MDDYEILDKIARAVVEMDSHTVIELSKKALCAGINPEVAIEHGLARGMEEVGELFASGEYFVPEVVVCSDAMYAGLEILKPVLKKSLTPKGRILIGVVEGDTHDIGKNIVAMMLEAAGFEIHDLGRNVPLQDFASKALEVDADIIALSSLMTTTMDGMKAIIDDVQDRCRQERPYVIVGGAPVSRAFAERIGADGYASNATEAVRLARRLVGLG